ncbi:tetratricopeptide repeat protein [Parabacteroides sp. TM07-1AC]|jgi:Flp pilus assembly protein TadD|uniref:tetratricopeptide repeat protein n=1 Tax=Parabacteroides sp. TM07-1AC TaxID=2292363 RepID=UPI000F0034A7|nr:tetratricopeptide repeat protein [Parabacteroides sp. TM07-1AC]RHU24174.1 tetratricopeptide repeat protein [Parabacteroides sp. TM07-1AC]
METIRQLINDNKTDEALRLLDEYIKKNEADDEAYYLRGNAYRKIGDIRQALNNYLTAMELNPDSPAQTAYNAQIKILDFYNKDMYNH